MGLKRSRLKNYWRYFFAFGGAGVRSMTRSASSNLTPLRFSGGSLRRVFMVGCFLFTVSFPSPTIALTKPPGGS